MRAIGRGLRIGRQAAKHRCEMSRDLEVSMEFDPEEGITNLDEHLDTLKQAAEAEGFSFDRHAARNELQAATFGKSRPAIARLMVSPSGAIAIEVTSAI